MVADCTKILNPREKTNVTVQWVRQYILILVI